MSLRVILFSKIHGALRNCNLKSSSTARSRLTRGVIKGHDRKLSSMTKSAVLLKCQTLFLWMVLLFYVAARLCQLYADRLPALMIVMLHVIPPAVFALVHGSILYRKQGMAIFTACCLGVGGLCESLSLRTGFPFGHYYFTDVMGPQVFHLPVLLVLAYLGIGYVSWVLSLLILGYRTQPLTGLRVVIVPVLASFLMLAWDLSMEAVWSTIDKAWIWKEGGAFFGVPISNFFGWYLTAFLGYLAFALYSRARPLLSPPLDRSYWRVPILFYTVCAIGNLLIFRLPMTPPVVADATGKMWMTADVLEACALISMLVMLPMALLAWLRLKEQEAD